MSTPSPDSPTPLVDAEVQRIENDEQEYEDRFDCWCAMIQFARQLEREREALDDKVSDLADERDKYATTILSLRATLTERDREIERLRILLQVSGINPTSGDRI